MTINPKMWDDDHFVPMSDQAQLLFCHLLTGYNGGVPGLILGDIQAYAGAKRWDIPKTEMALEELAVATFIEYDRSRRLLRIPGRPKYVPCTNGNVLKGWFRRWKDLPDSPLKYRHIESISEALSERAWFAKAWDETFGEISVPEHTRQVPLFRVVHQLPVNSDLEETAPNRNNSERVTDSYPLLNVTVTDTDTNTSTDTSTKDQPRVRDPIERGMIAGELWRLQEELRSELASDVTPRDHPSPHDLRPIMGALELYSQEDLENSLRVNAATASQNPEKLQYFNGYNNWHPNSLKRTVGQVMPASTGRHAVRGRKKMKGGSALEKK